MQIVIFFVLLLFSYNVLNALSLKCIFVILRLVDAKVFNVETSHANECNEVRDKNNNVDHMFCQTVR